MSTFREFATGFELGQQQRKTMQRDKAMEEASGMFQSGNYEGAESALMAVDPQMASAYGQAGERRKQAEKVATYSKAFKAGSATGGTKGGLASVGQAAGQQGDFDTAANIEESIGKMDATQRELAAAKAGFLADASVALAQIKDPAQRKAAFDQIVATSGQALGITPQQAASFDLSDQSLQAFYQSSMSVKDQLTMKASADQASATQAHQSATLAETSRHNRAMEGRQAASGNPPPSGYRWKADGTLERIPGGPADKPPGPEYDAPTMRKFLAQAQTLDALEGSINQYMDLIRKDGPQVITTGLGGDNPIAKKLDAANTNIKMQAKALFDLGVINGPDLQILNSAIPPVTGFDAWGKTKESVDGQLQMLRDYVARGRAQIPEQFVARARPNGAPKSTAPSRETAATSPFLKGMSPEMQKAMLDMAEKQGAVSASQSEPDDLDAHIDSLFDNGELDLGIADAADSPTGSGAVPAEAAAELMRDPSAEAQREFDEAFGDGMAERVLNASR